MRFHVSHVLRTLYTLSLGLARARAASQNPLLRASSPRTSALRSMPSLPLLGSLFGTNAAAADASKMTSYPDKRTDDEWRAVLNKGTYPYLFNHSPPSIIRHPSSTHKHKHKQRLLTTKTSLPPFNRAIPHPPRKRHRTPRLRQVRQALPRRGRLHLRRMRRAALHGRAQVQQRLRLARLL